MRINVKSLTMFEAMTGKSYLTIFRGEQENFEQFVYCVWLTNTNQPETFETFKRTLDSSSAYRNIIKELEKELAIINSMGGLGETDAQEAQEETLTREVYMTEIAHMLIARGVAPQFVMYQLDLWDIASLSKALNNKLKDDLERERMWVFLLSRPHLRDDVRTATSFYPFPWDGDNEDKSSDEELALIAEGFENMDIN